ncbi:MAG: DNA polymerase III subunit [Limisphaera sp.]|nr:DNA polymerase III subunit [Limisphaera sp.]
MQTAPHRILSGVRFPVARAEGTVYNSAVAFRDLPREQTGVSLLQRSLAHGRLGHAYLFTGPDPAALEPVARSLAKTLLCQQPERSAEGAPVDCCDRCSGCRRVDSGTHPDVHWVRPESKSRVITIDQVRDLSREIFLKPHEAPWKVGILVDADCLNLQAANALLKTLEEPPSRCVLMLLSAEPARLLETIVSRCMRVHFAGPGASGLDADAIEWVRRFAELAAETRRGVIDRYRMVDLILQRLAQERERAEAEVKARWTEGPEQPPGLRSGPRTEPTAEPAGEDEGPAATAGGSEAAEKAAIEAEYRRRRDRFLGAVQGWLRDVWLARLCAQEGARPFYPGWAATSHLASRLTEAEALRNLNVWEDLQNLLRRTNVQELLAIETAVLQLELGEHDAAMHLKSRG